ncbi:EAL domain-containing protein [Actinoplanes awajinensis]|uniref:EAL domain-containing protein n=1 Tax=Actinoplanes awajinensis TaxID=135946 RepID=UPI0009FCD2DF|nr:EAL domain-containing protein [Actinoplanes awajinensis]
MVAQRSNAIPARRLVAGSLIERIVAERAIYPVFQPIVDLSTHAVVGVEALARGPAGSALETPDALFAAAIEAGLLTELDQLCYARALETVRDAGPPVPPLVFVNAEPAGLSQPMSPDLAAVVRSSLPFRIVLEFTERALTSRPAAVLRLADLVHSVGNAVALDDVGADPASLAFLPLVEPDVVKLDMHLIRDPYSPKTQATAAAVVGYADRSGATVLAEGIETPDDEVNAAALGARWGQGWLFGRPGPLETLLGREYAKSPAVSNAVPGLEPVYGDTPFAIASHRHPVRVAGPDMADALIDHVVASLGERGRQSIVLCAINEPGRPSRWLPRLTGAADHFTYLALLSGSALPDVADVQIQRIEEKDPLREETVISVLTEDGSMALCMKSLRPESAGDPGSIQFVHSQNRHVVHPILRNMMRRFGTW